MEFGELKAEAYSSLSILQNTLFSKICRIFFSLLETEQRLNSDFTIDYNDYNDHNYYNDYKE